MSDSTDKTATIRARLKFTTPEEFIEKYAPNVSRGGIFVKTGDPRPVGTPVRFEFQLTSGVPVLRGVGDVAWIRREPQGDLPAGMGIRFRKLDVQSQEMVDAILTYKQRGDAAAVSSRFSMAPRAPSIPPPPMLDSIPPEPPRASRPPAIEPETPSVAPPPAGRPSEAPRARRTNRANKPSVDLREVDNLLASIAAAPTPGDRPARPRRASIAPPPPPTPAEPEPTFTFVPPPSVAPPPPEQSSTDPQDPLADLAALTGEPPAETTPLPLPDPDAFEPLPSSPPPPDEEAKAVGRISRMFDEEVSSAQLTDLLEPEGSTEHLMRLSDPPDEPLTPLFGEPAGPLDQSLAPLFGSSATPTDEPALAREEEVLPPTELEHDYVSALLADSEDSTQFDLGSLARLDETSNVAPVPAILDEEPTPDETGDDQPATAPWDTPDDEELAALLAGQRASIPPSIDAPETLPDEAIPPGLVRPRPSHGATDIYASGTEAPPEGADQPLPPSTPSTSPDAEVPAKKGFFKKLFGK